MVFTEGEQCIWGTDFGVEKKLTAILMCDSWNVPLKTMGIWMTRPLNIQGSAGLTHRIYDMEEKETPMHWRFKP